MSDITARIVAALQTLQREHAAASLESPQDRSAFEYGRVSGIYAGLGLAWHTVLETLRDEKEQDDQL